MGAVPDARAAGTDTRRIFTVANVARGLARRIDELPALWVDGDIGDLNRNDRWASPSSRCAIPTRARRCR